MHYQETIAKLSPAVYERLKSALEIGKWPDGKQLTQAQRQTCLEAVLSYQKLHLPPQEQAGYLHNACPTKASPSASNNAKNNSNGPRLIKVNHDD